MNETLRKLIEGQITGLCVAVHSECEEQESRENDLRTLWRMLTDALIFVGNMKKKDDE